MTRMAILAFAALALAGCASSEAQTAADRDCFRPDDVSGYTVIDDNHIGVSVGANRQYILTTLFNARDLDWTQAIAIRSSTSWICTGNGLGVSLVGGDFNRTYPVNGIARAPETEPAVQGS